MTRFFRKKVCPYITELKKEPRASEILMQMSNGRLEIAFIRKKIYNDKDETL